MTREQHPLLAALAEAGEWSPPALDRPALPQNGTARVALPPAAADPQAASYAASALEREADRVATLHPDSGVRNDSLNTAAFRMGQLAARGWLHEQVAESRLIDAGMACGLAYLESSRTVRSGLDAGMAHPREGVELHEPLDTPPPAFSLDVPTTNTHPAPQVPTVDGPTLAAPATEVQQPERPRQLVDGGAFIYGASQDVPALWGEGDEVLWAAGEPCILTGPTGVGKTTLGTMLVAARLGLLPEVLEIPVKPGNGRTLVWAMDRPAQIQRAMARLLRGWPRETLDEKLIVWQGPPPMDMGRFPNVLYSVAEQVGADTVVIDSLKDAAVKLSDEEIGQGLNRAMNMCVSNGVEVLAYHHQKKHSTGGQGPPTSISDVYGSSWITAGAGSVILLWGSPGDLIVKLTHLKQPAGEVGPLNIGHDHLAGRSFVYEGGTDKEKLLDLLRSGPQTAPTLATWLLGADAGRSGAEKIRRRLEHLVRVGVVIRADHEPSRGGPAGGSGGIRYALATGQIALTERRTATHESAGQATHGTFSQEATHGDARRRTTNDISAGQATHGATHATHAPPTHVSPPPFRGGKRAPRRASAEEKPHAMTPGGLELNPGDERVCSRCHRPAPRFIPGPNGRELCPTCAYPTEQRRDDEED